MSIRLYIGNLPQTFDEQELAALLKSVGEGIRFKSVLDRETGASVVSASPTSTTRKLPML